MINNQINLKNSVEFMRLTNWIREKLPHSYFGGIIASYTINAAMIGFFLFPTLAVMIGWWPALIVATIGTLVIQFFRGLIVFTDLLFAESGTNSKNLVKVVALVMTIVGVFELWHLLSGFEGQVSNGQLIGVFVFGSSIIVGGWMMEINFIEQTNKFIFDSAAMDKRGIDDILPPLSRLSIEENAKSRQISEVIQPAPPVNAKSGPMSEVIQAENAENAKSRQISEVMQATMTANRGAVGEIMSPDFQFSENSNGNFTLNGHHK